MTDFTTEQTVLFPDLLGKPLVVAFDQPHGSSDGGAVLLKAADRRLGLIERLASSIVDRREGHRVRHEVEELVGQRIYGIACGYPDCADAARLGEDPIHKLLAGRDPVHGERLGSQPTLSRLENGIGPKELYRMAEGLADSVIERHAARLHGRARHITIDLDTTDLETYGEQQLTFFNGFYHEWCYVPLVGFVTFNDEPEQYAVAAMLRSGKAPTMLGALGMLRRLLERVRGAFPEARIRVRLDGGFACPEMLGFLEEQGVSYVVGLAENAVLKRKVESLMSEVRVASEATGKTETLFDDCAYMATTWPHSRRVVMKAEVVRLAGREPRDNARFVVTNMRHPADEVYMVDYCGRGEIENRLKELKELRIDRTSCRLFWANQLRVLLALAAYVLMQEVRSRAARTSLGRLQVATIRERLLKVGASLVSSVRRLVLHLPANCPWGHEWRRVAIALGAAPG